MVAAAVIGSTVVSAGVGLASSGSAASGQQAAANDSAQVQQNMFNTTQANLQPYIKGGNTAMSALNTGLGLQTDANGNITGNPLTSPLLKPITMDQTTLQQTPGYQFNLNQGLQAVQNSAAARGLGNSGAAMRGAADYATGLADSTYQNQFNNAVTNQTNTFNRLMSLTNLGENASANLGNTGTQTASNIGNALIGGANAAGASQIAGANMVGSSMGNMGLMAMLNGGFGGSGRDGGMLGGMFGGGFIG